MVPCQNRGRNLFALVSRLRIRLPAAATSPEADQLRGALLQYLSDAERSRLFQLCFGKGVGHHLSLKKKQSLVFSRLARYGLIDPRIYDHPLGNVIPFLLIYAIYFEFVAHAAIAINRFYVLKSVESSQVGKQEKLLRLCTKHCALIRLLDFKQQSFSRF